MMTEVYDMRGERFEQRLILQGRIELIAYYWCAGCEKSYKGEFIVAHEESTVQIYCTPCPTCQTLNVGACTHIHADAHRTVISPVGQGFTLDDCANIESVMRYEERHART